MSSFDTALNFGATATAKVTIPSNTEFSGLSTLTVSFWKRNLSYVYNSGVIGGTGWPPTTVDPFYIAQWYGGMTANFADGTSGASVAYDFTHTDTSWHHYVVTFDSGVIKTYTDGVYSGNTTTASFTATNVSASSFVIGDITSRASSGFMSNMQVFNSSLSASDILTLYNGGTPLTDMSGFPSMRSWWKLDNTTTGIVDAGPAALGGAGNGEEEEVSTFVSTTAGGSSNMTQANLVPATLARSSSDSNYSFDFDGVDDYFTIGNPANLQITGALTLSAWVKISSATGTHEGILYKDDGTNRCYKMQIEGHVASGNLMFTIFNSNVAFHTYGTSDLFDGNWHHVAAVYTPSNSVVLYVDGVLETNNTGSVPASIDNDPADFEIGRKGNGALWFGGNISNGAIWNSALSAANIITLYNNGRPGDLSSFSPAPVSWWKLGDDAFASVASPTAWTIPDQISTNDGTSAGNPTISGDAPGSTANGLSVSMDIEDRIGESGQSNNNAQSYNMATGARKAY